MACAAIEIDGSQHNQHDTVFTRIALLWHRCHIGQRSEYSVERLLAFRDYYQRASITRVIGVCVLTPIPSLLTALLIGCTPLESPSAGWKANYAAWIRLLIATTVATMGVVYQVIGVIEPAGISIAKAFVISFATASCNVLTMLSSAATWTFPTPFGYALSIAPFVMFFSSFIVLAIGPRQLYNSLPLRQDMKSALLVICSQGVVAGCYVLFSAVFNRLSGVQQAAFTFVTPLVKFLTKQNIANAAESFHEYVAPLVVFSVDLFNVFYVAICMQVSKSIGTTLIIMASDSLHLALALRSILMRKSEGSTPHKHPESYVQHLLKLLRKDSEKEDGLHRCGKRIRLFSPLFLPLSDESKTLLEELSKTGRFASDTTTNRRYSKNSRKPRKSTRKESTAHSATTEPVINWLQKHQIVPAPTPLTGHHRTNLVGSIIKQREPLPVGAESTSTFNEKIILDSLQDLFHSDYILLAEYVEFAIPLLYAPYLVAIFHLPVGAYYPNTSSMTEAKLVQAVTSILIYSAIEFLAFGVLLLLLHRKFGFSPLYQLAFVLETHAPAIQGHLFVWTITILHLTLRHYGKVNSSPFSVIPNS
ncbi:unnamed protein product [Phytophthora fragariaefolia]|uniref:Unnamed protein product n=1 Tax=Phytophthora fragariaefolia TaxID=1490495 RepID=A0A9W6TXP2_9STRA|nr:unnamed protein product [Phytophthora fragariaefolia]